MNCQKCVLRGPVKRFRVVTRGAQAHINDVTTGRACVRYPAAEAGQRRFAVWRRLVCTGREGGGGRDQMKGLIYYCCFGRDLLPCRVEKSPVTE